MIQLYLYCCVVIFHVNCYEHLYFDIHVCTCLVNPHACHAYVLSERYIRAANISWYTQVFINNKHNIIYTPYLLKYYYSSSTQYIYLVLMQISGLDVLMLLPKRVCIIVVLSYVCVVSIRSCCLYPFLLSLSALGVSIRSCVGV